MPELYPILINRVYRRIGGLEIQLPMILQSLHVYRRIGGLEIVRRN